MPAMPDRIRDAALRMQRELADETTPFVRDAWYVAALADEVTRQPLARRLLGVPVMLYRKLDGTAVALEDRCAHRSFPLSRGTIDGDTVVCGYHGARLRRRRAAASRCRRRRRFRPARWCAPSRCTQRGTLLWIWMGAPEQADAAQCRTSFLDDDAGWVSSHRTLHLKASYVRLHENLLDLTHLSFLHANSFGTPDYASAPYETQLDEAAGRFTLLRTVMPTRLPPLWAKPTGLEGVDAARIAESTFHSPALHVVAVRFHACDRPSPSSRSRAIRTAHIVTPETATSTHYFIQHARNFALQDDAITQFMHEQLRKAFQEDVDGLEAIESLLGGYCRAPARDLAACRPRLAGDAALPEAARLRGLTADRTPVQRRSAAEAHPDHAAVARVDRAIEAEVHEHR